MRGGDPGSFFTVILGPPWDLDSISSCSQWGLAGLTEMRDLSSRSESHLRRNHLGDLWTSGREMNLKEHWEPASSVDSGCGADAVRTEPRTPLRST